MLGIDQVSVSRNTHFEWLCEVLRAWKDRGGDDSLDPSCSWGGDEDLGDEVEMEEGICEGFSFVKRREKESEMKGIGIYRFLDLWRRSN